MLQLSRQIISSRVDHPKAIESRSELFLIILINIGALIEYLDNGPYNLNALIFKI